MLGHHLRRWPSIEPILGQYLVFSGTWLAVFHVFYVFVAARGSVWPDLDRWNQCISDVLHISPLHSMCFTFSAFTVSGVVKLFEGTLNIQ